MGPRLQTLIFVASGGVVVTASVAWWMLRRRKTPEDRERERRAYLNESGRITDGTIYDVREISEEGAAVQLLIFSYDVAGVSYEASQDVTHLRQFLDLHSCRLGLPASVKYDPHNPGNSIVIAEGWSGLRENLPVYSR